MRLQNKQQVKHSGIANDGRTVVLEKPLDLSLSSLKFAFEAALPQALGCGKENIRFQSSIYLKRKPEDKEAENSVEVTKRKVAVENQSVNELDVKCQRKPPL